MSAVKVLIIDDEKDFATTLSERLVLRGFDASAVFSVTDAMEAAQTIQPDVILQDLTMPGMDGSEVFLKLKTIDPDFEIIIISGQLLPADDIAVLKENAFDYILKPVEIKEIVEKINDAWQKRQKSLKKRDQHNG
ncbi:response regulator [Candidatus Magnetomonas plexicatena]|uniref:response regulator n=1 Tax=Candidatus Magnetomonas plexicatena TaxID=2552947 RepID=UPI001C77985B|nr:response regulator [Nitrospirales bacterium LBB_01]